MLHLYFIIKKYHCISAIRKGIYEYKLLVSVCDILFTSANPGIDYYCEFLGVLPLISIKFLIIFYSVFLLLVKPVFAFESTLPNTDVKQQYVYQLYYKKMPIGKMTQQYHWHEERIAVNSRADLSFLYYTFGGSQQSDIYWSETQQQFLNRSFSRNNFGFGSVDMTATFDNEQHKTHVVNNGVAAHYDNQKSPIVGFNTINLQISEGLKIGQKNFEFFMQTSDNVAHYFFEVMGKESISTKFGIVEAYRIEQIGKNDRIFVTWFAPEFGYQMVQFHYKRKVVDIRGSLTEYVI